MGENPEIGGFEVKKAKFGEGSAAAVGPVKGLDSDIPQTFATGSTRRTQPCQRQGAADFKADASAADLPRWARGVYPMGTIGSC